tara:strand:+ start:94 stop:420 length:327 start_codon:yes stop_codon:yes gene_type:complete
LKNGDTMSEDIEKIRAKKIADLNEKMTDVSDDLEDIRALQNEFTWADFGFDEPEWGFRESQDVPEAFEICQQGKTVALTQDPRWGMLVTDLLNRAKLEELIMGVDKDE